MSVVSREASAADRTTYLSSRRKGSKVGCSSQTIRVSLTLPLDAFDELRSRADQHHRSISRQAARLLIRALAEAPGGIEKAGALQPTTGADPSRVTALPPLKNSASRKEIDRDDAQQIHS